MTRTYRARLTSCSLVALMAAMPAQAQTASTPQGNPPVSGAAADPQASGAPGQSQTEALKPNPDDGRASPSSVDGDIIVTGSRVVTNGYQAPTPVTVLGTEELKNTAPSITEALRQLPQLTGSSSPSTPSFTPSGTGSSTSDTANLRNLGATRTLVLLDGRRPPASGVTGTADISLFPLPLIKRVDIVTGGASAAYGSDAVAGVVNFILDTKFRGVAGEVRNGISDEGDGHSYNAQAALGLGFAGDRGSLILSGSIGGQQPVDGTERAWAQRYFATIPNPLYGQAGEPQLLLRENVNLSAATFGGIIITPGVLRDIQFDASGNPTNYQHGTLNTGSLEVGGQGAHYPATLVADVKSRSMFAHGDFAVTDAFSVFAEGSYGYSETVFPNLYPYDLASNAYVIRQDNAYLPASIRETMQANGIASVQLAKVDQSFGQNIINNVSKTLNLTAGFNAKLGRFSIDGYFEHGESRYNLITTNQRITANAKLAADAVIDPATGQIVCRSTLTNPTNGCVPWSPFGSQALTAEQRAYQQGSGFARSLAKQNVAALTARGNLFPIWAGEVSAAIGAEYREQKGNIVVDPVSQAVGFSATNPQPSGGGYNVKEVFGEVLVPLLRTEGFLRSLDLNGAVRRTVYSTSGGVTTWKIGLTGEIVSGLRLRGTYSQDIRAPNIGDLYGPRVRNVTSVLDPANGNQVFSNIFTFTGSNPDLKPESARTLTAGFSYRPNWLRGFGASLDYYRIRINDAISTLSFQQIVSQCYAGNSSLCGLITRDSNNLLTQINGYGLNIQTVRISGVDGELSYSHRLGGGTLSLRGIGTYLKDLSYLAPGSATVQQAGTSSYPHLRANLQATYSINNTTVSLQERLVGSHRRVIPPLTVDNNHVPRTFYTSLTVRQRFDAGNVKPELFFTINNLFDQNPRIAETNSLGLGTSRVTDPTLYDTIGRYITIGARVRL